MRVALTTYLSTPEQQADWEKVKAHYGTDSGDAVVLRELIRTKAIDISAGNTKRQALDEIRSELKGLRTDQDETRNDLKHLRTEVDSIKSLLHILCEKVGVTVVVTDR
jgi:hypothetical protein